MSDKDLLILHGISPYALVDELGVAVSGTATLKQLAARGFQAACSVDGVGVASSGSTLKQLQARGIEPVCLVSELGAAADGSTLKQLQARGIFAMCPVDASGIAQGGTATLDLLRKRGIKPFCPIDETGTATTIGPDVTAPTITSATTGNNVEGVVLAHALTANEAVTWSIIGGADQAQFEISGSTLRWASNGVQDFEAPADVGTNNGYVVDVRATDTALNTSDQTITITVTDAVTDAPAAPDLTWNSLETDNEPDFLLDLPNGWGDYRDAVAGDHAIVERSLQSGGAWTGYIDRTLSAGDISDDTLTVTGVGSIANELYFFRAYLTRGNAASPTSANEAVTINASGTAGQPIGLLLILTKAA